MSYKEMPKVIEDYFESAKVSGCLELCMIGCLLLETARKRVIPYQKTRALVQIRKPYLLSHATTCR